MTQYKVNYIGYARVSTTDQHLGRQLEALKHAGVNPKNIYKEKVSGATIKKRPQIKKLLKDINRTNVVVVLAIDRLGRNYKDIKYIIDTINAKGARLVILNLPMSRKYGTDKLLGKILNNFVISLLAYQAAKERKIIKARQRQGIAIAKKNGVYKGRPAKFTNKSPRVRRAFTRFLKMKMERINMSTQAIADDAGMSKRTLYRKIKQYHVVKNAREYLSEDDYKHWMIQKHPDSKIAQKFLKDVDKDEDHKKKRQFLQHRYNIANPNI